MAVRRRPRVAEARCASSCVPESSRRPSSTPRALPKPAPGSLGSPNARLYGARPEANPPRSPRSSRRSSGKTQTTPVPAACARKCYARRCLRTLGDPSDRSPGRVRWDDRSSKSELVRETSVRLASCSALSFASSWPVRTPIPSEFQIRRRIGQEPAPRQYVILLFKRFSGCPISANCEARCTIAKATTRL